ncbi:MAG: thermostable hemolysin [Halomonas sp.]|nr:thermostable hemolysin [Halomonas sp.]
MSIPRPVHAPGQSPPPAPLAANAPVAAAFPLEWREGRHWHERRRLERLVRRCFAAEHGARIRHFLPRLFGLWQGGIPLAAVGAGRASGGPLFQEHYLEWVLFTATPTVANGIRRLGSSCIGCSSPTRRGWARNRRAGDATTSTIRA